MLTYDGAQCPVIFSMLQAIILIFHIYIINVKKETKALPLTLIFK